MKKIAAYRYLLTGTVMLFLFLFFTTAFQSQAKTSTQIEALLAKAEAFLAEESFDSALYYYKKTKERAESENLADKAFAALEKEIQVLTQHPELSFEQKQAALNVYWNSPLQKNPKFRQYYYDAQSSLFLNEGELDSLDFYYQKTMEVIAETKDWKHAVGYNTFLAQVFQMDFGDLFQAKSYIETAEKILTEKLLSKGEDFSDFYQAHSVIAIGLGDYDAALKSALKSLETLKAKKGVDSLDIAYEYSNLGVIYNEFEDFANAEKYFQQALKISEELDIKEEIALSYYNIAVLCYDKKDFELAKKNHLISLSADKESKKANSVHNVISNYQGIADCYMQLNELDSAAIFIELVEKLHQKSDFRIQRTYEKKGRLYQKKKNYKKAIEYLGKNLAVETEKYGLQHPQVSRSYLNIANVYYDQNTFSESLTYLQKALAANSPNFEGAEDWRKNPDPKTAMDKDLMLGILYRKIRTLDKLYQGGSKDVKLEDIYANATLATRVLSILNKSLTNVETKRYWLNREAIPVYEQAINLALQLAEKTGKNEYRDEAFKFSEQSKSILLLEAMQEQNAGAFGGVPDSVIQKERRLARLISNMEKKRFDAIFNKKEELAKQFEQEIFLMEQESDLLKRKMESKYPDYYKLKYEENVANVAAIQAKLDDKTVFVEYFEGLEKSFIFAVRKNEIKCIAVNSDSTDQKAMMSFQLQLSDVGDAMKKPAEHYNKYVSNAFNYYKRWVAPILKATDKDLRLVLVPDGTLGYIPFEALLTELAKPISEEETLPSYSNLSYLMHKYRIAYNYSGTLWLSQLSDAKPINGKILAMAPSYIKKVEKMDSVANAQRSEKERNLRAGLNELPGAAAELEMLKKKYNGTFLKGIEANEKNVKSKASEYGILHLAMHGLVDDRNPEFSSLAFAEDGYAQEDNFFYAYEIKQMQLKASLVVLSACETGAGKYQRGEGVVSLGRGFMYAGAPSLVMTLWSLNDQSASALVENFYTNLAAGMEKDEALRQAKIAYLEKVDDFGAHPALWACFVQLGNYSKMNIEASTNLNYVWIIAAAGMILAAGVVVVKRSFNKKMA